MMADSAAPITNTSEDPELSLKPSPSQQSDFTKGPFVTIQANDPCHTMTDAAFKEGSPKCTAKQMENTVKAIGQGLQASCLQWEQMMVESEQFEMFCPNRVDKLLQEAKALEAHLLQQKEQLIGRLRKLSETLQVGQ